MFTVVHSVAHFNDMLKVSHDITMVQYYRHLYSINVYFDIIIIINLL